MKNKRGDISITILVIMVLVLFIFALFTFYTAGRSSAEGLLEYQKVFNLYAEQERFQSYLVEVANDSVLNSGSLSELVIISNFQKQYLDFYAGSLGFVNTCRANRLSSWNFSSSKSDSAGNNVFQYRINNINFICESSGIGTVRHIVKPMDFSRDIPLKLGLS